MLRDPASFRYIAHSSLCPAKTFLNTFTCFYLTKITNCKDRTQNVQLRNFSQLPSYISSPIWKPQSVLENVESWEVGLEARVLLSKHRKQPCCCMLVLVTSSHNLITDCLGSNLYGCGISHGVQERKDCA